MKGKIRLLKKTEGGFLCSCGGTVTETEDLVDTCPSCNQKWAKVSSRVKLTKIEGGYEIEERV